MIPLPHKLNGNPDSKQLIVFLHGWPDTMEVWDNIIPEFEKDYYILNLSYPNFSVSESNTWGIDHPVLVDRIKLTIDLVNQSKRAITFVGHDWGAAWSFQFDQKYPNYVSDMISLDLSPSAHLNVLIFIYQVYLIIAFLIGGKIGALMTKLIALFVHVGFTPAYRRRVNSSWNYPYYYSWKAFFQSRFKLSIFGIGDYKPSCPLAYVWGKKKPCYLHTKKWLEEMKQDPRNFAEGVNAVHWINQEQPEYTVNLIKKRLNMIAHVMAL